MEKTSKTSKTKKPARISKRAQLRARAGTPRGLWDYLTEYEGKTYLLEPNNQYAEPPKGQNPNHKYGTEGIKAMLAMNHEFRIGGSKTRTCSRCKRLAVRGLDVCYFHGGRAEVERRKIAKGQPVGSASYIAGDKAKKLFYAGLLDPVLTEQPVFRATWALVFPTGEAWERRKANIYRRDIPQEEIERVRASKILLLEMIKAWHVWANDGDVGPWEVVLKKAKILGHI